MSEAIEGEIVTHFQGARVTKHPEETVQRLEAAFNYDFNITEACQYADISRKTFYEWLADDDIFSYRMSVAQAAPKKIAKEMVVKAMQKGDAALALRYLQLRDPDFKPKAEVTNTPELVETRQKIREFLDDKSDDAGSEPATTDSTQPRGEVASAPTDIS